MPSAGWSQLGRSTRRPNLLIDVADGVGPFGEEAWVSRDLHVGTAVLSVQVADGAMRHAAAEVATR